MWFPPRLILFWPEVTRSGAAPEDLIRLKEINFPLPSRAICAAISPDGVDEFCSLSRVGGPRGQLMRRVLLACMALLVLPASLAAAPARQLPVRQLEIAPKEVILGWINQYRHHPEPEQAPLAVHGLSRLGIL